ncbi:MAG: hypothetical protein WC631_02980 [Candidatus Paceibacterota bacterium]|jgi:hypothetical protein
MDGELTLRYRPTNKRVILPCGKTAFVSIIATGENSLHHVIKDHPLTQEQFDGEVELFRRVIMPVHKEIVERIREDILAGRI